MLKKKVNCEGLSARLVFSYLMDSLSSRPMLLRRYFSKQMKYIKTAVTGRITSISIQGKAKKLDARHQSMYGHAHAILVMFVDWMPYS
ncbi:MULTISPECIES: hypothetical protein [Paraburkholderia]|uniref:Uncharacterized protein n=1 Tax=Paraburkholderia franconis TaxID=2654983 RepID=A0A7X1NB89_9BURK|nr:MULTISPECIES: hypothetical protein [Paraburkholderia]MPW18783.1 hypothetical protein [Paraburkholderia franconis]